jgi:hypothetical protein
MSTLSSADMVSTVLLYLRANHGDARTIAAAGGRFKVTGALLGDGTADRP